MKCTLDCVSLISDVVLQRNKVELVVRVVLVVNQHLVVCAHYGFRFIDAAKNSVVIVAYP